MEYTIYGCILLFDIASNIPLKFKPLILFCVTVAEPGPAAGQTAYVFTAVGTPAPAAEQKLPLNLTWVKITTGRSGSATLKPNPGINPDGPTTLTAIVDTGSGSIMSTIFGQVTTVDRQCTFMPTIGSTEARSSRA